MFKAVVLAGGGKQEPLTEQEKVTNKAFIELNGKPLLTFILAALEESPQISETVVVGPLAELSALQKNGYKLTLVSEANTMLDNVAKGLEAAGNNGLCLVVTGDIPLITPSVIDTFLNLCQPHDCDFYYPVLNRKDFMNRFPDTERTYVRLEEGLVTGGNIALINPAWFLLNRERLELFVSYRKKPLKLMRLLPFTFLFKYIFKTLSVDDLVKHLSKLLDLKAAAVKCECVEIGIDVDKPSDLELVREVL